VLFTLLQGLFHGHQTTFLTGKALKRRNFHKDKGDCYGHAQSGGKDAHRARAKADWGQ